MRPRLKGKEFIAILPGANQATLVSLAERIRVAIERSFLIVAGDMLGNRVSIYP